LFAVIVPLWMVFGMSSCVPALSASPALKPFASAITNHSEALPYIWLAMLCSESPF
jgi:hypothetical protein